MSDNFETTATSILAGVRDNLLKPLAMEIEQKQQESCDSLVKAVADLKSALEAKISALEIKIAELEKLQREAEKQRSDAMRQVKWDE